MNDKTEVLQHIKNGLTGNPIFVSHVLLVTLDKGADHHMFFNRLANVSFDVVIRINDEETKTQVKWQCIKTKTSSHVYWCASLYNDRVVAECTKKILEKIAQATKTDLNFLVTTPLHFDETFSCEYECTTSVRHKKDVVLSTDQNVPTAISHPDDNVQSQYADLTREHDVGRLD